MQARLFTSLCPLLPQAQCAYKRGVYCCFLCLVHQVDFQSLMSDCIILDGAGDSVSRPPCPIRTTFLTTHMCRLYVS